MASLTNIASIYQWLLPVQQRPFIIAGPCSAEDERQLARVAEQLRASGNVSMLRAGVWKPRTRPGSFEGVGERALPWLQKVQEQVGIPVVIEVGSQSHVEKALQYDIRHFWVGARTTVNPFLVQEIADALQGTDAAVLVKNPINPDLDLWAGALERFANAGLQKIGAIHRGFSSYEQSPYRNQPRWELPIELRRRYPNVPLLCDPSHIAGERSNVASISQTAMDLNFDGLMVETHENPDEAWSDAQQQVQPTRLNAIIQNLHIRKAKSQSPETISRLEQLRGRIDRIDSYIVQLLAERMSIAEEIGDDKKANNVAIYQPERWAQVVNHMLSAADQNGLSREFIFKLYEAIHKESINRQSKIMHAEHEAKPSSSSNQILPGTN